MNLMITNTTPKDILSGFHRGDSDFQTFANIVDNALYGVIRESSVEITAVDCRHVDVLYKPDVLQMYFFGFTEPDELNIKFQELAPDTTLWGLTGFYHYGFIPPHEGAIPIESPEGIVVAEWFPEQKVFITLFDSCDTAFKGCTESPQIFTHIMETFAFIYSQNISDGLTKEELTAKYEAARKEQKKRAVVAMLNAAAKARVAELQRTIMNAEERMDRIREEMVNLCKTRDNAMAQYNIFSMQTKEEADKLVKEFDALVNVKHVVSFDVSGNNIIITTDNLVMPVKDRYFLAGRFRIEVDAITAKVRFFNLDEHNQREAFWSNGKSQHPHVSRTGDACLGNATEGIVQCVHNSEWQALATILISFLQQANIDDPAGERFYEWDECDKDGNVIRPTNHINPFKKMRCQHCHADVNAVDIVRCNDTGKYLCKDCAVYVPRYEYYILKDLVGDSSTTKSYVICKKCGETVKRKDQYRGTCKVCKDKADAEKKEKEAKAEQEEAQKVVIDPWAEQSLFEKANVIVHNSAPTVDTATAATIPTTEVDRRAEAVAANAIPLHVIDPWAQCDCPTCVAGETFITEADVDTALTECADRDTCEGCPLDGVDCGGDE